MGCGSSTDTVVQPLRADEDETGSKHGGRGDSAVSKGTADSGVVMENREILELPGAVPRKALLPTFARENEADADPSSLQQERQKSSEILKELLNQGIIPECQTSERSSGTGEAYNIMLDNREGTRRRPPARLESLKAKKEQRLPSREEIEEKIKLAEERRKLREDELKARLRTKSARVRGAIPTSKTEEDEDTTVTPVEPLQSPLTPDLSPVPLLYSQIIREAAEGGDCVRESGGDGRENREGVTAADERGGMDGGGESGDNNGGWRESAERIGEDSDGAKKEEVEEEEEEEELTQVEEFTAGQLLSVSGELENDDSFLRAEDKEEVF
ncbi:stathmin domain-containing protein 1 [Scomber scombrus]|uniref:stathmin domain-containing protein 1 n=1 Tax=Scomber scombrus TaxID=13677 RepID=UPI002DD8BBFA|nr:stathmin domain-containing protein 1 [Scomber scombrus]